MRSLPMSDLLVTAEAGPGPRSPAGLPFPKFAMIHTLSDAVCRFAQAGPASIDGFLAGEPRMPAGDAEASVRQARYLRLFWHGSLNRQAVLEKNPALTG